MVKYTGTAGDVTVFALDYGGYLFVDKQGNKIDSKTFEGADKVKSEDLFFCNDGFIVVQQVKVKKVGVGLRIRKFDSGANELWSYDKFPEKGRYNYITCATNANGNLGVLFSKGGMTYEKGFCLLGADGSELAFQDLAIGEEKTRGLELSEGLNGELILKGYLYDEASSTPSPNAPVVKPLALSLIKFNGSTGAQGEEVVIDFKAFQAQYGYLRSDGTSIYTGNEPMLQILDIASISGKDYFICESLQINKRNESIPSSTSGVAPTVKTYNTVMFLDYYLLEYNKPDASPMVIWKPERIVELKTGSSFDNESSARDHLLNNDMFSYQGLVGDKILSRGYAQMHNYYTLIDIKEGVENISNRTFWSLPLRTNPNSFPISVAFEPASSFGFFPAYFSNEGILSVNDGFMIYSYDYRTNQLQLSTLNF